MKARVLGGIGLGLAVLVAGCQKSETGEVTYSDSYIKAPIANNQSASGYITLVNGTKEPLKLTSVSVSPDVAAKVELHGHAVQDGVMKMYKVDALDLPADEPVALEPSGYHVMLMGLKQPLSPPSDIAVTFGFSDGEKLIVNMPVKANGLVEGHKNHNGSHRSIHIKDASARVTMPGMTTSAAYMTIENQGKKALSLVSVSSPFAKKTELHTTVMQDGTMKMRHIDSLNIEAGSEVVLKPGGYHVMLMGLDKAVEEGMEVPVELTFNDGSKASLNVLAMKKIPAEHMAH